MGELDNLYGAAQMYSALTGRFMKGFFLMPNVYGTPDKLQRGWALRDFAISALRGQGYAIEGAPNRPKKLLYITEGGRKCKVIVRTSQDTAIAFPKKRDGSGWVTLDDADYVLVSSVDDFREPRRARVHLMPGNKVREHFDRAYEARRKAHHSLAPGRGIWLALYREEANDPVSSVGAGLGLLYPPIAEVDLDNLFSGSPRGQEEDGIGVPDGARAANADGPLTIPEAKRRLAATLDVPVASIRITIDH